MRPWPGASWTPAVRLNDDRGTNSQILPSIGVDQSTGNVVTGCAITGTAINSGAASIVTDATCTLTVGKTYFLRATGYPDAPFTC